MSGEAALRHLAVKDLDADDTPSVAALYDLYADLVARWAQRLGPARCDVDDLVQQVFLQVHRKLGRLRSAPRARAAGPSRRR